MKAQLPIPKLTTYEEVADGFRIDCTTRSWVGFLLIPFTFAWCLLACAAAYQCSVSREGVDLFQLVVLIWFFAATVMLISFTVMLVCGEVKFQLCEGTLKYFSGIWPVGRKKSIQWSRLDRVSAQVEYWGPRRTPVHLIYLEEQVRHKTGRFLSAEQRSFVLQVIDEHLRRRSSRMV